MKYYPRLCFRRDAFLFLCSFIPRSMMENSLQPSASNLSLTSIASPSVSLEVSELTAMDESTEDIVTAEGSNNPISPTIVTAEGSNNPISPTSYLGNAELFICNRTFFNFLQDTGYPNIEQQ